MNIILDKAATLNIVDRYPNGQFIAEFEKYGVPSLTSGMKVELPCRKYGKQFIAGFGTTIQDDPTRRPYLSGSGTTICSGEHPDSGKLVIRMKGDEVVRFDGKLYQLEIYQYEHVRFNEYEGEMK